MKVTTKTFLELAGTSVGLGELRTALLDFGDDKLLTFRIDDMPGGFHAVRLEIT
jgi:hypothetical protein